MISFAFPIQYGLLVSVLVKIFIAGSGAYVFGRTMGFSRISSALAGITFELCGAFTVWLGWSQSGSWPGAGGSLPQYFWSSKISTASGTRYC